MDLTVNSCIHNHSSFGGWLSLSLAPFDALHRHLATVYVAERLGIVMNLKTFALSQYGGYIFNSLAEIGGKPYGASDRGIFLLEGDSDEGKPIESFVELATDFGVHHVKSLRKLFLMGEAEGDFFVEITPGRGETVRYEVVLREARLRKREIEVGLRSYPKSRFWTFKLGNVKGCDFSLDSVGVLVVWRSRRPRWQ